MKSLSVLLLVVVIAASFMMTGCAGLAVMRMSPAPGMIYTDVKAPLPHVTTDLTATGSAKVGMSTCTSILGWVGQGDASIEAAMKAGGITKVHHVDFHATQILGLYATYTTIVYGE